MTKPQEYREQRVILRDTQYQVNEHFTKGPQASSGMLSTGRVVWIAKGSELPKGSSTMTAFAEGIGIVSVDAQSLRST